MVWCKPTVRGVQIDLYNRTLNKFLENITLADPMGRFRQLPYPLQTAADI